MLSDREWRELMLIEEGLRDDRRLLATFGDLPQARRWRRWPAQAVMGFGLLLVATGLLLGVEGISLQGAVLVGSAYLWWRWRGNRMVSPPRDAGRTVPRPGKIPPGWLRPM